jgi:sigma-B regulation protein RsbU (phosphoserine phosphatase)
LIAFFPPQTFSIPCLSAETFYQPARGIGGDYYDFLSISGGRRGIAIGDVSGEGIGAALLMASLQASLRAQALHPHLDLPAIIGGVNHLVHESSPTALFASLFYAEYEPANRRLQYVNAGDNPPIIVRSRTQCCELFHLRAQAVPIGIYAEDDFSLWKITPPLGSDIGYESDVAIETSGDLRLVGTRAFPAFALSVRYACDGC